jgi:hypothetical protein
MNPAPEYADVVQDRMLVSEFVSEKKRIADPIFACDCANVLLSHLKVTVDEPVVSLARHADGGYRCPGYSVVWNAEIRQSVQIGMDVIDPRREVARGRPLHRCKTAPTIIGGVVAFGHIRDLPHAVHAD